MDTPECSIAPVPVVYQIVSNVRFRLTHPCPWPPVAIRTPVGGARRGRLIAHDLLARWAEPHRRYHTLAHLEACLAGLDGHRELAIDPVAVEAALWFHDAIYDPRATDNEARSAALAVMSLQAGGVAKERIAKINRLILATSHRIAGDADMDPDTVLLLDLDLAILGAPANDYYAYAAAIRREYIWVPEADFRQKRAAVLAAFLQRPRIYGTARFFSCHEETARANLAAERRGLHAITN